jgi:hypothetical protein
VLSRRVVRAGLLGSALAVLTLAGHTAGSGAVDALGLGIVAVLSIALAAALSARTLALPTLIAVLLAGQGFLHLVVSLSAAHPHGTTGTSSAAMLAGHAVAGIVAAILIAHADRLAARWQAYLASVIGADCPPSAAIEQPTAAPAVEGHDPRITLVLLLHGVARRGPPASVVLA